MRGINKLSRSELISCYDIFIETESKYFMDRFSGRNRPKCFSREIDWTAFAIQECREQILKADPKINNVDVLENLSVFFCDSSLIYQQKNHCCKSQYSFNDPFYVAHEIIEEFIDFLINTFGFDVIRE